MTHSFKTRNNYNQLQMGKMVGRLYNTRSNLSIVYLFFHFYQSKCPSICISTWHFFTYMIYYCC